MKRIILSLSLLLSINAYGQTPIGFQSIFHHAISLKINLEKGSEIGFGYVFYPGGPFFNLQAEVRWPTASVFEMKNSVSTLGFNSFTPIRGELAVGYGAHLQLRSYNNEAGKAQIFGIVGSFFPGWYWQGGRTIGGQNGSVAPGVQAFLFPVAKYQGTDEAFAGITNGFQKQPIFRLDAGIHADYFFERTLGLGGTSMAQVLLKQPQTWMPESSYTLGGQPVTTEFHTGLFYGYSRY